MSNFTDALQEKIDELEEEKDRIDGKIELLQELIGGDEGKPVVKSTSKKKRPGRPKGSKGKKKDVDSKAARNEELYKEVVAGLGEEATSAELQERMVGRFNPQPRPVRKGASNIHAGTRKGVDQARESALESDGAHITVDDEDET